jgi:ferritin-like protein
MVNREKQAEVLRRTQAKRKEQKKEQVLKAIQELLKQKKPLTFKNIATVSGCSVSYLYKWDDIKAYIHELQQQKETTLNSLEEPEGKDRPHSLKTLHQVAKDRILRNQR